VEVHSPERVSFPSFLSFFFLCSSFPFPLFAGRFVATREGELTIRPGDVVVVTDISRDAEGWWEGSLNGQKGVFPCGLDYVDLDS